MGYRGGAGGEVVDCYGVYVESSEGGEMPGVSSGGGVGEFRIDEGQALQVEGVQFC